MEPVSHDTSRQDDGQITSSGTNIKLGLTFYLKAAMTQVVGLIMSCLKDTVSLHSWNQTFEIAITSYST